MLTQFRLKSTWLVAVVCKKSQKMFIDTHKYNFNNIPCESEVKVLEGASKCNYIVKIMKLK